MSPERCPRRGVWHLHPGKLWRPGPDGPNAPACVRVTLYEAQLCDPKWPEEWRNATTIYNGVPHGTASIANQPLDFAVCFNGATPASVGWPDVQQVELAPWQPPTDRDPPDGGAPQP